MSKHFAAIAAELQAMAKEDQAMRIRAGNNMELWDAGIDQRNTVRLKEIVAEIGWPTISKVGAGASQAAWLLVQHAAEDLVFMRLALKLMKAAPKGDVALPNIAFLDDRVHTMQDKPQLYGTQFLAADGAVKPFPIKNPERLEARRKRMGLEPFAENEARIKAMYQN